jgi:Nucleoside diphosphate kinase
MVQRTFSIIKPDAVNRNLIGEITARLEKSGLSVIASKMLHLTTEQAAGFYAEHEGKPFYETLITNMTAGPIIVQVLEGEDAVAKNREVMGTTDPEKAAPGTIRKDFAVSMQKTLFTVQTLQKVRQERLPISLMKMKFILDSL